MGPTNYLLVTADTVGINTRKKCASIVPDFLRRPLLRTAGRLYPKLDWAPRPFRAKATLLELAEGTD